MFSINFYIICKKEALKFAGELQSVWVIYLTFVTLGFGFALYLFLAFWLKIKDLVHTKRTSVFDL